MSPDEIFAAHMWPWPDPMLKRDMQGRIVFVNAAFLQLYGGRVEDWRGNNVGGWPAPTPGHAPSRFETRLPAAGGERIYDWIEYVLADGFALGFARDVTDLLQPADPPPGDSAAPSELAPPTDARSQNEPAFAAAEPLAAQAEMAIADAHQNVAPTEGIAATEFFPNEPAQQVEQNLAPNLEPSRNFAPDTSQAAISAEPVTHEPSALDYSGQSHPVETQNSETHSASAPEYHAAEQNGAQAPLAAPAESAPYLDNTPPVRDHERRALPIENGDAVLGNNWRDAVIAKAVGADLQKDSHSEDSAHAQAPANPAPQRDVPIHAATPSDAGVTKADLRILLAEDNAINALLTRTLLEAEGCTVDVVEDGALAVEAVKNARYDMIFMDMRMPNMDGLESTRKIRSLSNVPTDMPIVALTANAFDDDRNACFDSGMNDFMTKPVSAEELSEMVERWAMTHAQEQRMAG